jgi:hypothetical protein
MGCASKVNLKKNVYINYFYIYEFFMMSIFKFKILGKVAEKQK